jgi:hypothetical protein
MRKTMNCGRFKVQGSRFRVQGSGIPTSQLKEGYIKSSDASSFTHRVTVAAVQMQAARNCGLIPL